MGSRASDNYTLEPSLGSGKEGERQRELGGRVGEGGGREEWRISSLRFDRVGVDRRLIDSPPQHGNFFEEPLGLPFFYNTYSIPLLLRLRLPVTLPSPLPSTPRSYSRAYFPLPSPARYIGKFDDPMTCSLRELRRSSDTASDIL